MELADSDCGLETRFPYQLNVACAGCCVESISLPCLLPLLTVNGVVTWCSLGGLDWSEWVDSIHCSERDRLVCSRIVKFAGRLLRDNNQEGATSSRLRSNKIAQIPLHSVADFLRKDWAATCLRGCSPNERWIIQISIRKTRYSTNETERGTPLEKLKWITKSAEERWMSPKKRQTKLSSTNAKKVSCRKDNKQNNSRQDLGAD